ncbi:MAG: hypothetical protein ACRCYX_12380 [Dermatophilaceae bacterium]
MTASSDPALEPLDDVDAQVLRATAALFDDIDPVPAGLVDDIKFALTVQALQAEVAELQRAGANEYLVRSEYTQTPTLTFSAESVSAMVTLTASSADTVRIDGWVTGHDGPVTVEVRDAAFATVVSTRTDADGRFVLEDLDRRLVRFVFRPEDATVNPVITPAVEI